MRAFALFLILLLLAASAIYLDARRLLDTPMRIEQPQRTEVARGSSLRAVLAAWEGSGWFVRPRQVWYLRAYARINRRAAAIKAGEYELPAHVTPIEALRLISSGKVILHGLTVVEGWTFEALLRAVHAHGELVRTVAPDEVMAALGAPGTHPEGRFLPETYHFPSGTTDLQFLRRAYSAMQARLTQEWAGRAPGLPYATPEEALTMASIIERETGVPEERGRIAGVFVRRLSLGMKLQTDPTVIYGLGSAFDGNLRRRDLVTDNPYNTYTRTGLPPTPICLPGAAALRAAMHPADGDALYFVSRRDGTHQFSATLEEHNAAVRRYQLGKRP